MKYVENFVNVIWIYILIHFDIRTIQNALW